MCIAEILNAVAWPLTIILLVYLGRDSLRSILPPLVGRVRELNVLGAQASFEPLGKQTPLNASEPQQDLHGAAELPPSDNPAVHKTEVHLLAQVEGIPEAHRIRALVRHLAETRVQFGHEYTYNRIFGSQIDALRRLVDLRTVSFADAVTFFNEVKSGYPTEFQSLTFEKWVGFLIASALVERKGDDFTIATYGDDFIRYIDDQKLTSNRPL